MRFSLPLRAAFALAFCSTGFGSDVIAAGPRDFVPKPSAIFSDFTALEQPRADVPVGALWVQGFGPHGPAAAADNIETIRSLSGVTLNREMQLRFTLGLASFLNIDPGYRSRINARFADVTIVRVKDIAALAGPAGEPRIYEALKAGTITITTDSDLSADLNGNINAAGLPVLGRGDNGHLKSFTIDGKDMFVAFRIVTMKRVRGKPQEAKLRAGGSAMLRISGYEVEADASGIGPCQCGSQATQQSGGCSPTNRGVAISIRRNGKTVSADPQAEPASHLVGRKTLSFVLPVPIADGQGGLFTTLSIEADFDAGSSTGEAHAAEDCGRPLGRQAKLTVVPTGTRIETLAEPKSKDW